MKILSRFGKGLLVLLAGALCACSGADHQYDFITLNIKDASTAIGLNMDHDQIESALASVYGNVDGELTAGIHLKWGADKTTCVSIQVFGSTLLTTAGISINNSKKADVLAAYQKDNEIKILQNDASRIILGKQIDGVNYTLTFRFYPDGEVKYISLTNTGQYTENDKDFP